MQGNIIKTKTPISLPEIINIHDPPEYNNNIELRFEPLLLLTQMEVKTFTGKNEMIETRSS